VYDGARYARRNQTSADDRSAISTESAESTEYVRYRKWYVVRGKSGVCKQYFTVMRVKLGDGGTRTGGALSNFMFRASGFTQRYRLCTYTPDLVRFATLPARAPNSAVTQRLVCLRR
jgi:hypothetical protein